MTEKRRSSTDPQLITIPTADTVFQRYVAGMAADLSHGPAALERRLRRTFPRVVVQERQLSGERPAWYVYREGRWRPPTGQRWWEAESVPWMVTKADGWLSEINPTAAGMCGIDPARVNEYHFTDLSNSGNLEASLAILAAVLDGHPFDATVLLRPTSGHAIAVEIHAERRGDDVVGFLRFADEPDLAVEPPEVAAPPPPLVTSPATDAAFRSYALRAMSRMPEATPDGLALRLHRVYPHATVRIEGETWCAEREPTVSGQEAPEWWADPSLPSVCCDAQGLVLEANDATRQMLGREVVGHYWQEFVVPGSSDAVVVMLEILREAGSAQTRFRMPRADGTLVEFDSYTTVDGEKFTTVMRPVDQVP